MRAAYITGKEALEVRTVDTPEPTDDEVRLRVEYVGVCGSDLHYYFDGANGAFAVREPLIPGHELSGRVDLDPSGTWEPGTPVTVHPARFGTPAAGLAERPHLWPGGSYLGSASTWPHTQGALSEYLIVDRNMVRAIPETLPIRTAALAEPLAVSMHAVVRAGEVGGQVAGKKVLVTGSGPIGLLTVAAARAAGAAEVGATDVLDGPLARARALGADHTWNVAREQPPADAFDVVFECSGAAPSVTGALAAARRAGTVVLVGMMPDSPRPVVLAPLGVKELTVAGTFRFRDEIDDAIALLDEQPGIAEAITHEFSADETVAAMLTARDSEASGKVLVVAWPEN